jgi:flagellar hook-associated protein 1 FlgK
VGYTLLSGNIIEAPEGSVTGGSLGGILKFRSDSLEPAQNAIGRLSLAIGQTFNDQHKLGIDLNGAIGTDMFSLGSPVVYANKNNTSAAIASATITNAGNLTTSDYALKFDGTNYTLTRLSDNKVVASQAGAPTAATPMVVDGVSISLSAPMNANDSFQIQPTRNAAASFGTLITDPAKVAAASPARADVNKNNTGTGTAKLTNVAQGFALLANAPITATYNSGTGTYTFTNALGAAVVPTSTAPNGTGTDVTFNGMTFTFNGAPNNGDTFTLANNTGAVADNGNALALAKLQTAKTINGTSSFNDAYAQLVNDVGSATKSATIASTSQDSITNQIYVAQQSVSGVNMDEETVNMLKFQQLYQANARVIQTASTLFDTLIGIGA